MEENKNSEFEENTVDTSQNDGATEAPHDTASDIEEQTDPAVNADEEETEQGSADADSDLSDDTADETSEDDNAPAQKQKMDRVSLIIICIMAVMIVALSALLIFRVVRPANSGDGNSSDTTTDRDSQTTTDAGTTEDTFEIKYIEPSSPVDDMSGSKLGRYSNYDYDLSQLITLPDYANVQVDAGITREMLDSAVKQALEAAAKSTPVTDRPVQEGDTVDITFVGYVDGQKDDNCSGNNPSLVIGSHAYIDGFESGLIGKEPNTNVTLNLTFPNNYKPETYAGKAVTFEVTINSVSVTVTPELDDAFVAANSEQTTVDEYLAALRVQLHEQNYLAIKKNWDNAVLDALLKDVKISSLPQEEYRNNYDYYVDYYRSYASYYGYELEAFVTSLYGITMDEFYKGIDLNAQQAVKYEMTICYISRLENITLSDDDYNNGLAKLAAQQKVTASELESTYGKETLSYSILTQKTIDFITDRATVLNAPVNAAELDASLAETTATTTAEPGES